jgi:hypothetical protein
VKLEAARAEKTFERMRGDGMTNDELRRVAEEYLHSTLSYCEELGGGGVVPDTHEEVEAIGYFESKYEQWRTKFRNI